MIFLGVEKPLHLSPPMGFWATSNGRVKLMLLGQHYVKVKTDKEGNTFHIVVIDVLNKAGLRIDSAVLSKYNSKLFLSKSVQEQVEMVKQLEDCTWYLHKEGFYVLEKQKS